MKYLVLIVASSLLGMYLLSHCFSDEFDNNHEGDGKLIVNMRWSHQCNVPKDSRSFLAGESVTGLWTVSGYPSTQQLHISELEISIWDEDDARIVFTYPKVACTVTSLCVNSSNLQESPFTTRSFRTVLPDASILPEGKYIFRLNIKDTVSGFSGNAKLKFTVMSPNSFKLINVNFAFITPIANQDVDDSTKDQTSITFINPVLLLPLDYAPAVVFRINGLAVNDRGEIDICVKTTQYSAKNIEIWSATTPLSIKAPVQNQPLGSTIYLRKLYPGDYRVKIEVEDKNSNKKESIELPYSVINSIDILNKIAPP